MNYDKIIIGAGLYGLYSALECGKRGQKVLVIEHDDAPFKRATYINQARVHMGYHYPRSFSTAIKSAHYFKRFNEDFRCEDVAVNRYFKAGVCDGAFLTEEYTYDAQILKQYFLDALGPLKNVTIKFGCNIKKIEKEPDCYTIYLENGEKYSSDFVLNATYASVNQILKHLDYEPFKIKYELCEIIICDINEKLRGTGITVMDGPFFLLCHLEKPDIIL